MLEHTLDEVEDRLLGPWDRAEREDADEGVNRSIASECFVDGADVLRSGSDDEKRAIVFFEAALGSNPANIVVKEGVGLEGDVLRSFSTIEV